MLELDYWNIVLLLGALIAFGSGLLTLYHRGRAYGWWMLLSISATIWALGYLGMINATSTEVANVFNITLHYAAILVPVSFIYFVASFTGRTKQHKRILTFSVSASVFFLATNYLYVLDGVQPKFLFDYAPNTGPLYLPFFLYYLLVAIFSWYILLQAIKDTKNLDRIRYGFMLAASVIGFVGGGSVFFYTFNINLAPYPIILWMFYPIVITYASIRHELFNTRTLAAELFIAALWFVLLIRLFLAQQFAEFVIDSLTLLSTVGLGMLLIRSIYKEIKNREKGERLARYLANANARLRELDKQKTEFVSIASHQLRSPIAAIKGYTSLIIEGSYGEVPKKLDEPLNRVLESGQRISIMVDDFLNVTRIEQGRMTYSMVPQKICTLLKSVVQELQVVAKEKGLSLGLDSTTIQEEIMVLADEGKLKQIFSNLIDNAVKYTQKGSVTVQVEVIKDRKKVLVKIIDTGIGIAPDEVKNLFQKFNRASNANKVNVLGTGLGLYIAREIMKAHDGWIGVHSDGLGMGSTFTVELPLYEEIEGGE